MNLVPAIKHKQTYNVHLLKSTGKDMAKARDCALYPKTGNPTIIL
jgi:hypothetical protein